MASPRFMAILLILCLSARSTMALSTGAAGCEEGRAAVSGLHTSQGTVLTGELSEDDIEFQINGVALQPFIPFDIEIGMAYTWTLKTAGSYFRGFLARLGRGDGNVDTRQSLTSSTYTAKVAEAACVDAYLVGGVTHNSNFLKNVEQGNLTVHLPSQNMPLDVTVVIQNRNGYSIYYYSQFTIHANAPGPNASTPTPSEGEVYVPLNYTYTYSPSFPPLTAMPYATLSPATLTPVTQFNETSTSTTPVLQFNETPAPTLATSSPFSNETESQSPLTNETESQSTLTNETELETLVPYFPLFLRYPTCSATAPCSLCQGDCDLDDDCDGDLECFHRPQEDTSPVPGCVGAGVTGRDYCYVPQTNSLRPRLPECTAENPCSACVGDCDADAHCMAGLECFIRGPGELTPVFGCSGLGVAGLDYCYNASAFEEAADAYLVDHEETAGNSSTTLLLNGTNSSAAVEMGQDEDFSSSDQAPLTTMDEECSETSPCEECFGDCDADDSNCANDMLCFVRPQDDLTIVPGCAGTGTAGADYCWYPVENTLTIRTTKCDRRWPCEKCQGECKKDDECAEGLSCFRRQDLSVVPGCGNGFEAVNFCWDPNDDLPPGRYLRH